jgi:hypothetical protein
MILQEVYEIKKVGSVEGAVCKMDERFQVGVFMVQDEIIRLVIHPIHQFFAVVDDGGAIAPREDCGKEPGYFPVLLQCEHMRYAHGVFFYKRGLVVQTQFFIEQLFYGCHILFTISYLFPHVLQK